MRNLITMSTLLAAVLGGCAGTPAAAPSPVDPPAQAGAEQLRPQVLGTLTHDTTAFTEGLEFDGGTLYESTGLVGKSTLRSGAAGQAPVADVTLPSPLFGEGVTVLGPKLWQLTWQNGIAIERDSKTLAQLRQVSYQGEGWGLCHQPNGRLVMSNGSSKLTFRDPATFAVTGEVTIGYDQLNELECVGDTVYANVWQTDTILRIDATTGRVTGVIDASGLLSASERTGVDVLNGIAAVPGTDEFLLTGKFWPKLFRVKFVPRS